MPRQRAFLIGLCGLFVAAAVVAGSGPVAVSPGHPSKLVRIGDVCPTFSWSQVGRAKGYELVVYRLGEEGEEAQPTLRQSFAGSVSSWTPSVDRCLKLARRYAWSVRALGGDEVSAWSAPSLFQVAAGPSQADFEAALQVVRSYLAAGKDTVESNGVAATGIKLREQTGSVGDGSPRTRAAPAATQLSVDGNIDATSFTGDGENLAGVATDAEMASHAGSADAHREHATLEESTEIDSDIAAHGGLPNVHHTPTVNTTCNGAACDGTGFTNLQWSNLTGLPTTTKGDLLVEDGADVVALPVGADGQVLVADQGSSAGVVWGSAPLYRIVGPAAVPETGQTTSYGAGDDGDLERGVVWPNPRFTKNGDGTVTDNLTGLVWLENANCASATMNWTAALAFANTLFDGSVAHNGGDCGLDDGSAVGAWRLPNVREALSLRHWGVFLPAVPNSAGTGQWTEGDPFTGLLSDWYWSSTTVAVNTPTAWVVDMANGNVTNNNKTTSNWYVWPVRGGQ